ncbi:MAG: hypothetical protein ACJAUD_001762 [Crocinitomicaceae bacterium]|jgi:hypothetical protein
MNKCICTKDNFGDHKRCQRFKIDLFKIQCFDHWKYGSLNLRYEILQPIELNFRRRIGFSLGEGQTVSGFAMDVNGKLRDAVIVEKELARVAYESTIRQNIDPALLEKTEANNYKAGIYPTLLRDYKHIVIKFEQELKQRG